MSEERIVNRVQQDPFLQADLDQAGIEPVQEPQTAETFNRDKTGRIEIPPAFPFPPPTQADLITQELKEAGVETDVDEVFQTQQEVLEILKDKFDVLRAIPARDPDLRLFKEQVIKAFKHLGLDTKQFFGV